ncbi:CAP domain-containing protein [Rubellimicrobium arenae]|uniref:CAP domain-containing protein n=1 Tax=Rubellimicrobium arenae TaxID=2817372 RepID=UPI001B3084F7|nr:CAP domain-containing protein [Rubellimicrobium arenae]
MRSKLLSLLVAPLLLSGGLVLASATSSSAQTAASLDASHSRVSTSTASEVSFETALNQMRSQSGLGGLRADRHLMLAAQAYAEDMARHGYHSHYGRDGSTVVDRARAAGCAGRGYFAENIAWGQKTAQATFAGWSASPGHRANMLGRNYGVYGLGWSGGMWVLIFADAC